jgi:hypothetical protein
MLAPKFRQYLGTRASFSQNTSLSPSDVIITLKMLHINLSIILEMNNGFTEATDPQKHSVVPPQELMTAK